MQTDTIHQIIQSTQAELLSNLKLNSTEAKYEALLLLQHAIKVNHAWLIAHEKESLTDNQINALQISLSRRLKGEPIAYILGYREFYGLHLKVSSDTLIPRPDTETLVDAALSKIQPSLNHPQNIDQPFILDLGTGTGAIALAIAKNQPRATVFAVDASQSALIVAIENAKNLAIHNIQFVLSDWFEALGNLKFDFIVSNPPYIAENDLHLQQGDLRFEPPAALASGHDGLDDIRQIVSQAPQYLNIKGWLMLEHGYNQSEAVAALLKQAGFSTISYVLDLNGIKRVTIGQFNRSVA